jgi:hypothetical protein
MLANYLKGATKSLPLYTSYSINSAATGTSLTIDVPAGAASGDLLIVFVVGAAAATWSAPSGWTFNTPGSGRYRGWIYYDGLASSYTFNTNTSTAIIVGAIICIKNADIDVAGAISATSVQNPIAPSITISKNDAIVFGCASLTTTNGNGWDGPSGWTTLVQAGGVDTPNGSLTIARKDGFSQAGATGDITFTRIFGTSTLARSFLISVVPR